MRLATLSKPFGHCAIWQGVPRTLLTTSLDHTPHTWHPMHQLRVPPSHEGRHQVKLPNFLKISGAAGLRRKQHRKNPMCPKMLAVRFVLLKFQFLKPL